MSRGIRIRRRVLAAWIAGMVAALTAASAAFAHVERPSYFPDPAPDTAVTPAAGGGVPKVRSLASSLKRSAPGNTRVVCQPGSLKRAVRSIRRARRNGYEIRPTDRRRMSARQARRLTRLNQLLAQRCRYREIQPAVTASGNNDRVVVMPGIYVEPTARAKPTNDQSCNQYRTNGDKPGEEATALSYAFQANCPNDQNLVAVIGRAASSEPDPSPPRENRHGIPNAGPCVRCNLQIEGSGVTADDTVIEAGDITKGNGGPSGEGHKKDVAIRADRADGFVLRNISTRHAGEHGIYVHETDGYMLDRFKAYYNRLYGTLTFASDHGVQQNCDAAGHGDSGLYPGGAPETGQQRPAGTEERLNQKIQLCDLRHNLAGYSGTNGNSVHVTNNKIYGNSLGIQTDVVTGAGHPGYPGDSALFENNHIYSNNFNPYDPDSDVKPSFPFPVGTGLWIAGGNHHKVRANHFYDNWRRGTMLFSVPDSLVCGPGAGGNEQAGCKSGEVSTSHYNRTFQNRMGITPDGRLDPNGTDFWWDKFSGSRGNCWFDNQSLARITTDPPGGLPDCQGGTQPEQSMGTGDPNEQELISCVAAFESRNFDPEGPCPWIRTPPEPSESKDGSPLARHSFAPPATAASAPSAPRRDFIPLGQATCSDWLAEDGAGKAALAARIQAFAGGTVNTGEQDVGTGAVLSPEEANLLFATSCSRRYAESFLLYKLYTHAAAFAHRR